MTDPDATPESQTAVEALAALRAESAGRPHLEVRHTLGLLERAGRDGDDAAFRRFAARLSLAYRTMGMDAKAGYYALLAG